MKKERNLNIKTAPEKLVKEPSEKKREKNASRKANKKANKIAMIRQAKLEADFLDIALSANDNTAAAELQSHEVKAKGGIQGGRKVKGQSTVKASRSQKPVPIRKGCVFRTSGQCQKQCSHRHCSQCKLVYYCDEECQPLHWKKHKGECSGHTKMAPAKLVQSDEDCVICQDKLLTPFSCLASIHTAETA